MYTTDRRKRIRLIYFAFRISHFHFSIHINLSLTPMEISASLARYFIPTFFHTLHEHDSLSKRAQSIETKERILSKC